ncbi:MAG: 4Fe-4S dicluster domain-containing protein, partial [Planctomycetota bacterium]|nr:4Fe-4S dicluster domain-containing protein [Planctomycetota bacterium]
AGFGMAATMASCGRAPVRKVIPYLKATEGLVPGKFYWIATTSKACANGCGVLARCRDGRPVKLEGNPSHPVTKGGLCASCQASLLGLYDSHRISSVTQAGAPLDWANADQAIRKSLIEASAAGGKVRVLTGTLNGPSTLGVLDGFLAACADGGHLAFDALSQSASLDAHERTHGLRVLPRLNFAAARSIVSFEADFLGTWRAVVENAKGYRAGREPEAGQMSRHWQFEACMSLTGTRADRRTRLAPWQVADALDAMAELVEGRAAAFHGSAAEALKAATADLMANRGHGLVVSGLQDLGVQVRVNRLNALLGNYGSTLDLTRPALQQQGDERGLARLEAELLAGEVDCLIVAGCNPAYDLPGFDVALAKAKTLITLSTHVDETSALATFACAALHDLEQWDDAELVSGLVSLSQPTVPPLKDGRSLRECLARWIGDKRSDRDLLREWWRANEYAGPAAGFEAWFDNGLQHGHIERSATKARRPKDFRAQPVTAGIAAPQGGLGLMLYPKVGLLDGRNAHNPWLQELPDPVTKMTWDNYACLGPNTAAGEGVATGDMVRLTVDSGASLELPVLVQPGQAEGLVAVALGYGRLGTDRFAKVGPEWIQGRDTVAQDELVGVNAAVFARKTATGYAHQGASVQLTVLGTQRDMACTQDHHSLEIPKHLAPKGHEVRDAARSTTLAALAAGHGAHADGAHHPSKDLWPDDHEYHGHRWGMAVDMSACTGCSACVISCQAENNVPVVGKDEIRRHREMSWIRIDRYYQGEGDELETLHQPMMCQHCTQAPCETVCPVLATMHSSEGLNQQVYNRCVGTRYCANNCPYKTRRFNWFDYAHEDKLQNMALNPDVTVRSRGVMEKCSMCIQRIQEGKAEAQRTGVEYEDGSIKTACQQSCPSDAIVFGDLNDPESRVSKLLSKDRAYTVLDEINVRPVVNYLARVTNGTDSTGTASTGDAHHG